MLLGVGTRTASRTPRCRSAGRCRGRILPRRRYGYVDFRSISDGLGSASSRPGGRSEWDHDIARCEVGIGYRLARNARLLGTFMHNENEELVGGDPDDDLFAVRLWWAF